MIYRNGLPVWLILSAVCGIDFTSKTNLGGRVHGGVALRSPEEPAAMSHRQDADPQKPDSAPRSAALIKVSLPITVTSASQIRQALKKLAESAPPVIKPTDRTVCVLEFDTSTGKTGRGSELEACQLLARYLASADLNRVETVAYIPGSASSLNKSVQLSGHAVLVAIACNQIVMDPNTAMGSAGIDESHIDNLVREVYRGVAAHRLVLPVPMVMAMLEKNRKLYRVESERGILFVDDDELVELEKQNQANDTKTLSDSNSLASFSGKSLQEFGFVRYLVNSRNELAAALNLAAHSLDHRAMFGGKFQPVEVNLPSFIDDRTAAWVVRSLEAQLAKANPPNLIIFDLDSSEGNVDACIKLARYVSELDATKVQTVAHVRGNLAGSAALLAVACDQLLMASDARLGGALNAAERGELTAETLADVLPAVKSLARSKERDWSLMMAMLDPEGVVERYRHNRTGHVRLLSAKELQELPDQADWDKLGAIDTQRGLSASHAEQLMVARSIANDDAELQAFYQLDEAPPILELTRLDRQVERFASFLSRPDVAAFLLFIAVFMLSTEMSSPGIGVPGFIATLLFMLFFWSQYLEGNANWLEILLFAGGVIFILIEIFATPGIGIFGIGGVAMVLSSLVLASQDFGYTISDLNKLPKAMMPVAGACLGFFAALFALRNVLPHSPVLKRLILAPREAATDTGLAVSRDPEAIVDWSYLLGRRGKAITRLVPSGKARVDGRVYDVITDGKMLDKGQRIEVVEAVGNRVVVQAIEE